MKNIDRKSVAKEGKEQIPRILHYFWCGDKDPFASPGILRTCYESWKKFAPDFEIKRWDESNFDMGSTKYTQYHFKNKLWSFISDYVRCYVLYTEGGIYLDTDMEIIRPLDDLLIYPFFTAFEDPSLTPDTIPNTGMGFVGSVPAHPFPKQMMADMERNFARGRRSYVNTTRTTEFLIKEKGLRHYEEQDISEGIHIFSHEAFYSFNPVKAFGWERRYPRHHASEEAFMTAGRPFIHPAAYGVHWYIASWQDGVEWRYPWYLEWWYRLRNLSFYRHVDGFLKRFWIYRKMKEPINKLRSQMEEQNPTLSIKPKRGGKEK
ncbi:MAG: glycosyltransferase [Cytophagales bacterium]|nr:glycosyltransferase [Cytophagales bacterium]